MNRLLVFARHYPPAISGGARRPFLLARELRKLGVDVRVCAPSLPDGEPGWAVPHPKRDPATGQGPPAFDLKDIARDLLLWPDPDIRWCRRAAQAVAASMKQANWRPDWILSTSPPESIHAAGRELAAEFDAFWAADFRDHWLVNPHRRERRRVHRQIGERWQARRLLAKTNLVLAVDDQIAAEMRGLGGRNVHTLAHFAPDIEPEPVTLDSATINIVHAGSIALSDPEARIEELLGPFNEAASTRPDLRLHLIGRLTDGEVATANASASAGQIAVHGPVSYARALGWMQAADALALVASRKMHVPPSKIVDYSRFDAPIIACGEGPWRDDPRASGQPASDMFASLQRGAGRNYDWKAPTPAETAARFLDLARAAEAGERS